MRGGELRLGLGLGIGLRAGNWGLGVRSYGWCALVASTG